MSNTETVKMSWWTDITEVVELDVGELVDTWIGQGEQVTQERIDEHVKTVLAAAPKISSSEAPAMVYVNRPDRAGRGDGLDDPDEPELYTVYDITVSGSLRGRFPSRVYREFSGFLEYLEKNFGEMNVIVE